MTRAATLLLVWLTAAGSLSAQSIPDDGLPLGPWLIAPLFEAEYSIDDNVRRISDSADDPVERIASSEFSLEALLPFRNSSLELNYSVDFLSYEENQLDTDLAQEFGFELELNFGTGDRLVLSDTFAEDFARVETLETVDPTGGRENSTFIGEPYRINRWAAKLERAIPDRRGYLLEVRRSDFIYKGERDVDFFDYRGYENAAEYRQPMPGNRWLIGRFDMRRFKHFRPGDTPGVHFRREISDSVQLGLLGELGRQQPFTVRLGYGRFRYQPVVGRSNEVSGLVGYGAWQINLGEQTKLKLDLSRQSLPANLNTYYVNSQLRAELEREIVRSIDARLVLRLDRNLYGDAVFAGCGLRDDRRWQLGSELEWEVHPRFGFQLTADYEQRGSNCDFAEYNSTTVGLAIRTGWF